ncbi:MULTISPECIES: zf-HC2 domain-containing protein [Pasteurellaceae]|uniref:Zf-HC2 domain-containing protein n=3 Tax=Pasteurellaceae TaxID=712 RepID=A0ACC6HLZ6_9PAST|nr:zf-HC2 domain-containing protein [Pasteurella atlantica]MBR0573427.1 zf-HC2 domain-containing protein [Pasteurella atlantica]MDP8039766.1 zf-HC2 domain-containing protein [Pasteurella atlantica]MDP8041783.1 zf-HC2 domain-containing protein [Pasteurella atlantica]MDP8043850.1 zf-HC2 domain-containing protein [Pasteurella atlantica]MDP8046147.1 zf-HC2 domain-containing protein [Pasteurella atlantica]
MKCLQVTQLVSQSHERKLKFNEKCGVMVHLVICPQCRHFKQNCQQMSEIMKKFANEE